MNTAEPLGTNREIGWPDNADFPVLPNYTTYNKHKMSPK